MKENINNVNNLADEIDLIIKDIVEEYCGALDCYMCDINSKIISNILDSDLESIVFTLPTLLYFTAEGIEKVGIREDISKRLKEEIYAQSRTKASGTVKERDDFAMLSAGKESMTNAIYSRAYKMIKLKMDAGYEMLNSVKKIMNKRITETELSNSRYINTEHKSTRAGKESF